MDDKTTEALTRMLKTTQAFDAVPVEQRAGLRPPTWKAAVLETLRSQHPGAASRPQLRLTGARYGQVATAGWALTQAIRWLEDHGVMRPDLLGWKLTDEAAPLVTGRGMVVAQPHEREQRPRQSWVEPERVEQPRDPEADYRTKHELLDALSSDKVRFYMEKEGALESTIRAGTDILTARGEAVPVIAGQAAAALEPTFEQRVQHAVKQMETWSDDLFTQDDVTMLGGDAASKPHNIEALARERERRGVQVTTAPPVEEHVMPLGGEAMFALMKMTNEQLQAAFDVATDVGDKATIATIQIFAESEGRGGRPFVYGEGRGGDRPGGGWLEARVADDAGEEGGEEGGDEGGEEYSEPDDEPVDDSDEP